MKLRKIIIGVCISVFIFSIFAVTLSIFWPSNWNQLLGSTILNIIAGLIVLSLEIIVAIFIVERYLEYHKQEVQKKELLRRETYRGYWIGWIHGDLSVLVDSIAHLSYFTLYGSEKWNSILFEEGVTIEINKDIGEFLNSLINEKRIKNFGTMKILERLEKGFEETPPSSITVVREDLKKIVNYMETCENGLRDQLFIFQPFMEEYLGLASKLMFFTRSLSNVISTGKYSLGLLTRVDKSPESFHLDDQGKRLFQLLGKGATEVGKLIESEHQHRNS